VLAYVAGYGPMAGTVGPLAIRVYYALMVIGVYYRLGYAAIVG